MLSESYELLQLSLLSLVELCSLETLKQKQETTTIIPTKHLTTTHTTRITTQTTTHHEHKLTNQRLIELINLFVTTKKSPNLSTELNDTLHGLPNTNHVERLTVFKLFELKLSKFQLSNGSKSATKGRLALTMTRKKICKCGSF